MALIEDTLFCDGCGVEIPLSPVIRDHHVYCCEDCAQGYECNCGERMELDERRAAGEDLMEKGS